MSNPWKTGTSTPVRKSVQWPTPAQLGKQIGIILVIVLLWGGLLAVFLQFTPAPTTSEAQASAGEAAVISPPTEMTLPTETPSPEPTGTPEPASTTNVEAPADSIPAEPSPTATPSPEPIATNTPEPPSPTPLPADSGGISFASDVLPIFENRCVKCHGGEKTEEGLILTNHTDILAGGWNGTVIEPGDPAESYLIEQIESGEMPKNEPRLLPSEIRIITEWVAAGAPDN